MTQPPKPILTPCVECPWIMTSRDAHFYWEMGGSIDSQDSYRPSYIIVSPANLNVVTVGLQSESCRGRDFDHLHIRVGALDAHHLQLDPKQTTIVFVIESKRLTTRGFLSFLKWSGNHEHFELLTRTLHQEIAPTTVAQVKQFIQEHGARDWSKLVPLKPYQEHRLVYRGLKLGEFLSDHVDADPALLEVFENMSGFTLPGDYREFILETNGGHLKNRVYFTAKGLRKSRELVSFKRFEQGRHLGRQPNDYFEMDPPGFLSIAYDRNNEIIYLGLDDAVRGKVYSVSNNSAAFHSRNKKLTPETRASSSGVRAIADTFSDFIAGLAVTDNVI